MKKFLMPIMGLLVVLSCGQKSRSSSDIDEEEEEVREELELKTCTFTDTVGIAHVEVRIDYPVKGEVKLVDAIRLYIAEVVGLESDEVELADAQGVTDYYGNSLMTTLSSLNEEFVNDEYVTELYHDWSFTKLYETDDYVTFLGESDIYEGGVHGINYQSGITFFENGQRFGKDMLRKTDSDEFQKLLRNGLRSYFSHEGEELSDENLAEELIVVEDVYQIPLPNAEPYFIEDGLHFVYQPYEISYYAAGMPEFTIPIKKMQPFLNKKAIRLLDLDNDDEDD